MNIVLLSPHLPPPMTSFCVRLREAGAMVLGIADAPYDSLNEYWLETEAWLRTEFNISGIKADEIDRIKRKSHMKRVFERPGIPVPAGRVCRTAGEAGEVVFSSSLIYGMPVLDAVRGGDMASWIPREIPDDLDELGRRTIGAFGVRERPFHFEYFRLADGALVALEVNMRHPGGLTRSTCSTMRTTSTSTAPGWRC